MCVYPQYTRYAYTQKPACSNGRLLAEYTLTRTHIHQFCEKLIVPLNIECLSGCY